MKITVTAAEPKDNEVAAKLTISQQDVDNAVKGAYKDIANKYSFKGFRRGRTRVLSSTPSSAARQCLPRQRTTC